MDPLTHLLDHPRAHNAFTLKVVMQAPWAVDIRDESAITIVLMTSGAARLGTDHGEWELAPGDVALIRGPDPYRIGDRRGSPPIAVISPGQVCTTPHGVALHQSMLHGVRTWGNNPDGGDTMIVASYESTSEIGQLVTDALPAVAFVPAGNIDSGLVEVVTAELGRDSLAQTSLLDRLVDVILISAVRAWLAQHPTDTPGWITATRDPAVGTALELIHAQPGYCWTIDELAAAGNVSRATLAARFRQQVGVPPMTYLARWRLTLASDLLGEPRLTLAAIARDIGYSSAFAFSTAFKKQFGVSPTRYRQQKFGVGSAADSERSAAP
jgi:AraC-like DNA-binding protein